MTGDASLRAAADAAGDRAADAHGRALRGREGGRLPLAIVGTDEMVPIEYRLPVASAQVKTAILLAGLNTAGETTVIEPEATRDHTERMLRHFGAEVRVAPAEGGAASASPSVGRPELQGRDIVVPGDPVVGGLRRRRRADPAGQRRHGRECRRQSARAPASTQTLREMGADIAFENEREEGGEPVADLHVRGGGLQGRRGAGRARARR